jgi:phage terminase small subunit
LKHSTFDPPWTLTPDANSHYQRTAEMLSDQGRWRSVSHDLVALYAESLATYISCAAAVSADGVLVKGRTRGAGQVRHPLLTVLNQSRLAVLTLAKSIPLTLAEEPMTGEDAAFDKFLVELQHAS